MACKCIEQVDELLAKDGVAIDRSIQIDFTTGKTSLSPPKIILDKIDSKRRKRMPSLVCTYCPFCGKKYDDNKPKVKRKGS